MPSHQKYSYGKHRKQYLCWFEPENKPNNQIILFFHGGAWTFGTPELLSSRASLFIEKGYTVVMPSHRKLPLHNFSHIQEDLQLILEKVGLIQQEKQIDNHKIIFGGMSSGANLAALCLFDQHLITLSNLSYANFIGAFLCAAPVNLAGMTDSFLLTNYAGKKNTASFQNASPINHLSDTFNKPLFIVHGTNDGLVKYESTLQFVEKLKKINTRQVDFYAIQNGSHLDAVSWAYENNLVRQKIFDWLEKL